MITQREKKLTPYTKASLNYYKLPYFSLELSTNLNKQIHYQNKKCPYLKKFILLLIIGIYGCLFKDHNLHAQGCLTYEVENTTNCLNGISHVFAIFNKDDPGNLNYYYNIGDASTISWQQCDDGTAILSATNLPESRGLDDLLTSLEIRFSGFQSTPNLNGFHDNDCGDPFDTSDWNYYLYAEGTFTTNTLGSNDIFFNSDDQPSPRPAFQIGTGANDREIPSKFSAGGWFYTTNETWNTIDIQFALGCNTAIPPNTISVTSTNPNNCPALDNGSITINASGSNLEYSISNGVNYQSSNTFSGLSSGNYAIRVKNTNSGCYVAYNSIESLGGPNCNPTVCQEDLLLFYNLDDCANAVGNIDVLPPSLTNTSCVSLSASSNFSVTNYNCNGQYGTSVHSCPSKSGDIGAEGSGDAICWQGTAEPFFNPIWGACSDDPHYVFFTFDATSNANGQLSSLSFYVKGTDINNRQNVRKIGVQIRKNGTVVFTQDELPMGDINQWKQLTIDLSKDADLELNGSASFEVRIQGYDTDGIGTLDPIWEIDQVRLYGCCGTECVPSCTEICGNGIDDDEDGQIDCADGDCGAPNISSVNSTNPNNCPTLNNGSIVINATGSNLRYSINNGTSYQSSNTFNGLSNGNYTIHVRNSVSRCEDSNTRTLSNPSCSEICDNGIDDDGDGQIDCADGDCNEFSALVCEYRLQGQGDWTKGDCNPIVCEDSRLELSISPDNYASYEWSGPNGFRKTGNANGDVLVSNLLTPNQAGTYTVTVTNNKGCTKTQSITINTNKCPCNLNTTVSNKTYLDNGVTNPAQHTFTYQLEITGSNDGGWILYDGENGNLNKIIDTGVNGAVLNMGPFPVDQNGSQLIIMDANNAACFQSIGVNMNSCIYTGTCACSSK